MGTIYIRQFDISRLFEEILIVIWEVWENNTLKTENLQLKEKLAELTDRQSAIEDMILALSVDLSKDKLASLKTDKR